MLTLRQYQQEAVDAVYTHLREREDNPCVVLPTASGKTPVLSTICRDAVLRWKGRVIILAHVKELLQQSVEHLQKISPELWDKIGVYSAGLKSRTRDRAVTVAGIQSVYRRACELDAFDLAIVDEAHLIPPDGDGVYRTFLDEARKVNPRLRVIGFTATPFRMSSGPICSPENILNHVCYEVGVRELIVQGYLCPLKSKAGMAKADTSGLHIRGGEFVADETEALMNSDELVESACAEIVEQTADRRAVLIFSSGVAHGTHIAEVLRAKHGVQVETVFGNTPSAERDRILADFRAGRLKYVVNMNVLTTGFDAPNIDCVALLRPTLSPGLYYQAVGRGFRLFPDKADCLILDFGGNVLRHGPVDAIRVPGVSRSGGGDAPAKECPECNAVIAAGYAVCPECGFVFPERSKAKHDPEASTAGILSSQVTVEEHPVSETYFTVHTKFGAPEDAPRTMRVDYQIGWHRYQSEWICFEHTGWARAKAESWWRLRSDAPIPESATEAVLLAKEGVLAETKAITVRSVAGEKYDRIVGYVLGDKPFYREPGWDEEETTVEEHDYAWLTGEEEAPPF